MSKLRKGHFFEDFRIGMQLQHATPRTVDLADQSLYVALTGSRSALASSEPLARTAGLPGRPLEDLLVFHIAFGKTVPDISHNGVANLGYAELRFLRPVFGGDTLTVASEVIGLRELSNGKAGVVYVRSEAANQHGQPVLRWVRWVMVHKGDLSAPAPETVLPTLEASVAPADLPVGDWPAQVLDITRATGVQQVWDDYEPGERIDHTGGMTINDSDHSLATRLYQNTARAHFDAVYMAGQPQARRLIYGGHVISLCKSLSYEGLENVLTWAAINGGQHVAPAFAGDTIRCATQVLERIELGHPHVGALRLRTIGVKNVAHTRDLDFSVPAGKAGHPPEVVLDIDYTVLMPRRPASR